MSPSSPQTYATYLAGMDPRRPTADHAAQQEVNKEGFYLLLVGLLVTPSPTAACSACCIFTIACYAVARSSLYIMKFGPYNK